MAKEGELRTKFIKATRRAKQATMLPAKMGRQTGASTWTFVVPGYPEYVYVEVATGISSNTPEKAKNIANLALKGGLEVWLDLDNEGAYCIVAQRRPYRRGHWNRVSTANVSNPPTDAELDTAFGTPATVGAGFTVIVDDNAAGTNEYLVWSDGTNWFYATGTKAT